MAENKDLPNPASNMEKAEDDRWTSDPDTVEVADRERQHNLPDRGSEREQDTRAEDVAARTGRGDEAPRRYEQRQDDDVMPSDDSSLNTKI